MDGGLSGSSASAGVTRGLVQNLSGKAELRLSPGSEQLPDAPDAVPAHLSRFTERNHAERR